MARALKPGVRLGQVLVLDAQVFSIAMNQLHAENAAQAIADSDATNASGQSREKGQGQFHLVAKNQVADEGQQRFIGNRQTDDPQHQQGEDSDIAVLRDPG